MAITFEPVDFDQFHLVDLPKRIEQGSGALAAPDLAGVGTIGFRTPDGAAYTYVPSPDTVEIWPGDAAAGTLVNLSREAFSDFANELRTCFGLLYAGMLEVSRGDFGWLERWEPALRALYHDRPIVDPATMGVGEDLDRSFTLDDGDAEMRTFLEDKGFLHVRGVLRADEIAALDADVERAGAAARPDDGASWWATRSDGTEVCCRIIYLGRSSALVAGLGDEPRLRRLADLGGSGLAPEVDCLDGHSVVIKQPEIATGLSDLPWHHDCGLGGHPVLCPTVAIGIQLDAATADTGQLHFLAGSHRGSSHPLKPGDEAHQPVVAIDTEPGDVTVHFGHMLHAAPPPTGDGPGRRALYVTYSRPETLEYVGPGHGYNDVLFEHDGQVHSVDEIPRRGVMSATKARPKYADLPDGSAWDVLDPALGSLELLTPERVAAAARLVKSGRRFSLDLPLDLPSPSFFGREPFVHTIFSLGMGNVFDDKLDNFFPQSSTQWDGFGHFGHAEKGFFGGRSGDDVEARTLGIEAWAAVGIAGRGVLLDVARHADFPADEQFVITTDLLTATATAQGVELREGDILFVRTGWLAWYSALDAAGREAVSAGSREPGFAAFQTPGLAPGPAIAEFLWDHGVAAIAVDNPAVEPMGPGGMGAPGDTVHTRVLALLGIPLGEFFDLEGLAADCAADGVYEFLFTSAPLGIPGGLGSPPNAIAIK